MSCARSGRSRSSGYVDTSAFVKLPLREAEHEALREELGRWDGYASSALLGVEALRVCRRYGETYAAQAEQGLLNVALLPIDDDILRQAAELRPAALRSLDAIHLATALSFRADLGAMIVYDERLKASATQLDLPVASPS